MNVDLRYRLVVLTYAFICIASDLVGVSESAQIEVCISLGDACSCRYDRRLRLSVECRVTGEQWPTFVGFNPASEVRDFRAIGQLSELPYSALRGSAAKSAHLERLGLSRIGDGSFEGAGSHLTALHLDGNRLAYLPSFLLRQLPGLVYLSVTSNLLTRIPDMRVPSPKLRHLLAGENRLTNPPTYLPNTLQTLILKSNLIQRWVGSSQTSVDINQGGDTWIVEGGEFIEDLDISDNLLTHIEGLKLDSALKLDVSYNRLRWLAFENNAPNLRYLDVSDNLLSSVSNRTGSIVVNASSGETSWLDGMPALRHLDLSSNQFTELPVTLPRSLIQLLCSFNRITSLDLRLWSRFDRLQQVDLSNNRISRIADDDSSTSLDTGSGQTEPLGWSPPSLRSLLLPGNRLSKLPDMALFRHSPYLSVLDLSNNRIANLNTKSNSFFERARYLYDLNLSWNNLTSLDASQLPAKVNLLRLSRNSLRYLDIKGIAGITSLHLDFNSLTEIPSFSTALTLEHLDISNNKIEKFDLYSVHKLHNLRSLSLASNKISGVLMDDLISSCDRLYTIDLSHNQLTEVSRYAFFKADSLAYLNLAANRITILREDCFRLCLKIVDLRLSHNSRLGDPGPGALSNLKYLRKLHLDGVATLENWLPQLGLASGTVEELSLTGSAVDCTSCETLRWLRDHQDVTVGGGRQTYCSTTTRVDGSDDVVSAGFRASGLPAACSDGCELIVPDWCVNITTPAQATTSILLESSTVSSSTGTDGEYSSFGNEFTTAHSSYQPSKHITREMNPSSSSEQLTTSDSWSFGNKTTQTNTNKDSDARATSAITTEDMHTNDMTTDENITQDSSNSETDDNITRDPTVETDDNITRDPTVETDDNITRDPTVETDDNITRDPTVETDDNITRDPTVETEDNITRDPTLETDDNITRDPTVETDDNITRDPTLETDDNITRDPTVETDDNITRDPTKGTDDNITRDPIVETEDNITRDPTVETDDNITRDPTVEVDGSITRESSIENTTKYPKLEKDIITQNHIVGNTSTDNSININQTIFDNITKDIDLETVDEFTKKTVLNSEDISPEYSDFTKVSSNKLSTGESNEDRTIITSDAETTPKFVTEVEDVDYKKNEEVENMETSNKEQEGNNAGSSRTHDSKESLESNETASSNGSGTLCPTSTQDEIFSFKETTSATSNKVKHDNTTLSP